MHKPVIPSCASSPTLGPGCKLDRRACQGSRLKHNESTLADGVAARPLLLYAPAARLAIVGSRSPSHHIGAATDAATDAAIDAATDAANDVAAGAAPRPASATAAVVLRSKGREFVLGRAHAQTSTCLVSEPTLGFGV